MKHVHLIIIASLAFINLAVTCFAADENFDSEKMMSELEKQLELSNEQMSKLKPAIDAKSKELKKSMHDAIDQGFVELEELAEKLDTVSKEAEQKVKEFLNSEEMARLKEYLNRVDEQAIREVKEKLIAELTAVLDLTQEQVLKLKPILEDSLTQISQLLNKLASEGSSSWEKFKQQYEELVRELRDKLEGTLNQEQMDRFEKYNEEKEEKIRTELFMA